MLFLASETFNPHDNPVISVYYYPYVTEEQAKEEGGSVICPVSHGRDVAESRFKPRGPALNQRWGQADSQKHGFENQLNLCWKRGSASADAVRLTPGTDCSRASSSTEVGPQGLIVFIIRIK